MYNDSPYGGLISTLAFGAMYLLGSASGRNALKQELAEMHRDSEIDRLSKELNELKKRNKGYT